MNRQRVILGAALAAGLVVAIAVTAQTQESTPTGCQPGETLWTSIGEPDSTFKTAEEAVAATLSDLDFKVSDGALTAAVAASRADEAEPGPVELTVDTDSSDASAVQVTVTKVADGAFAAGDAAWCRKGE